MLVNFGEPYPTLVMRWTKGRRPRPVAASLRRPSSLSATYLSVTKKRMREGDRDGNTAGGARERERQSEKKAFLRILLYSSSSSAIVRPSCFVPPWQKYLSFVRSFFRSFGAFVAGSPHQIQYRSDRADSARSAGAAPFGLVTFYCPWDTKVLGHGFSGRTVCLSQS